MGLKKILIYSLLGAIVAGVAIYLIFVEAIGVPQEIFLLCFDIAMWVGLLVMVCLICLEVINRKSIEAQMYAYFGIDIIKISLEKLSEIKKPESYKKISIYTKLACAIMPNSKWVKKCEESHRKRYD